MPSEEICVRFWRFSSLSFFKGYVLFLTKIFKNLSKITVRTSIFEDLRVCHGHTIYKNMPSEEIFVRFLKIFVLIILQRSCAILDKNLRKSFKNSCANIYYWRFAGVPRAHNLQKYAIRRDFCQIFEDFCPYNSSKVSMTELLLKKPFSFFPISFPEQD